MKSQDLDDRTILDDKTIFENFKRDWDNGNLTESDPIMKKVRLFSRGVHRFGWDGWREDIEHIILIKIYEYYSGKGSLEGFIRITMQNEITSLFYREHQAKRGEMPDDVKIEPDIHKRLEDEEEAERCDCVVEEIMFLTPVHLTWFIDSVVSAEGFMSERKIADKHNIKRNQAVKAKKELQRILKGIKSE